MQHFAFNALPDRNTFLHILETRFWKTFWKIKHCLLRSKCLIFLFLVKIIQNSNLSFQNVIRFDLNMWRNRQKPALWRNKYRRPWSDAAHNARSLIRAFGICRFRTYTGDIFPASCAVSIINIIIKVWKRLF